MYGIPRVKLYYSLYNKMQTIIYIEAKADRTRAAFVINGRGTRIRRPVSIKQKGEIYEACIRFLNL